MGFPPHVLGSHVRTGSHHRTQLHVRASCHLRGSLTPGETEAEGQSVLTDAQHDEGRVLPAGQQQEVDQVVGDEAEAQDHAAPLLEALA